MKNRAEELIVEIMTELYKNSTPSADYKELVKNAKENELGQKVIDFDSYYLPQDQFDEIVESKLKESRLPKWKKQGVKNFVYLGASPTCLKPTSLMSMSEIHLEMLELQKLDHYKSIKRYQDLKEEYQWHKEEKKL